MIALYDGPIPKGIMGCKTETLLNCYGDMENAVSLYKSDSGAVLCRFGQTLLVCGAVDAEILEFADRLGITSIESDVSKTAVGRESKEYPILYRDCGGNADVAILESLSECYNVICSADKEFADNTEYLYWLSDIVRRQNRGRAKAYCRDGAAAAVSAVGSGEAYLSQVAVLPEKRKEGRASALLSSVFSDRFLCGKRLYTAAQNEGLIPFYQKLGFVRLDKSLIILKKEHL